MVYIVCYSGGHSSALVAIEAVRKYGKENVILLNHNISSKVEHEDIKRFKLEVAEYLGMEITEANMENYENTAPLDICVKRKAFKLDISKVPCTYELKTVPFYKWLAENYPASKEDPRKDVTILYGFDGVEKSRMERRSAHLASLGYKADYPLANWKRTIENIEELGIKRPISYQIFKHANCIGCIKAGRQHWYVVYCLYPEIFQQAVEAEEIIHHSIIKGVYLKDLIPKYEEMRKAGIVPSDKMQAQSFWAMVKRELKEAGDESLSCECTL